jgi:hypothetical protein
VREKPTKLGRGRPDRWRLLFGALLVLMPVAWAIAKGFPTTVPPPPYGGYYLPLAELPWYVAFRTTAVLAWLGSLLGFFLTRSLPLLRKADLSVGSDHVEVRRKGETQRIARREVDHVALDQQNQLLVVRLRDGGVVRLTGPLARSAHAALDPAHEPRRTVASLRGVLARRGCITVLAWLFGAIFFVGMLGQGTACVKGLRADTAGEIGYGFVAAAALATMLAVLLRRLARRRIVVGVDAARIDGLLGPVVVPLTMIERVELVRERGTVLLHHRGAGLIDLPVLEGAVDLAARIEAARTLGGDRSAPPDAALLERAGRSTEVWREALRALAEPGGYRERALRIEDLEAVLADPRAPPERRVGAAIALGNDDATRARVRILADACADPDLEAALEAAADGEIAERALGRATRRHGA